MANGLLSAGSVLRTLRNRDELEALRGESATRYAYEVAIGASHRDDESWTTVAFCQPCASAFPMVCDWRSSFGDVVNFRESLHCPGCQLNNRQRFVAHVTPLWGKAPFYLYEQVTPFYTWARERLGDVTGSEYLGHGIASGAEIDGVRHEDALALSFADGSLGTIVSNDVFEHVPDIDAALAESARVLAPDGRLIFSIPFHDSKDETVMRAELRDGDVVELLDPQYHGNPVDEKGSLVFYDHGWDVLDRCREAGFADARVVAYWSALHGYLGGGLQMIFVASKEQATPLRLG